MPVPTSRPGRLPVRRLGDVRLHDRLTRELLPYVYTGVAVAAIGTGTATVVAAFRWAWWLGLVAVVVVPVGVLAAVVLCRLLCEALRHVLELNEYVADLAEQRLPRLEGVIDQLAADMPRLPLRRRGVNAAPR